MNLPLIICTAGLGSRLFPVTWAIPKELFPLNNKPALHFVLEEALCAKIDKVIFITSPRKEALMGYLLYNHEQNTITSIEEKNRLNELDCLNKKIKYSFVIQEKPAGVGNAMLKANSLIKENFFYMAHPDDIMKKETAGLSQLTEIFLKYHLSVILVEKVSPDKIHLYGVISIEEEIAPGLFYINKIIEKPSLDKAPSYYAIVGRYLLLTNIFKNLKDQNTESPCFVTAMNDLIKQKEKIIAVEINCKRYDIGTVSGWVEAVKELN